jgi:hypothetical protein
MSGCEGEAWPFTFLLGPDGPQKTGKSKVKALLWYVSAGGLPSDFRRIPGRCRQICRV